MILLLLLSGILIFCVGGLMLLIAEFTVSIWWGIFCILFPPTHFLFLILNWDKAKRPLLVQLAGVIFIVSFGVMTAGFFSEMSNHPFSSYKQYHWSQGTPVPVIPVPIPTPDPDVIDPHGNDVPELPPPDRVKTTGV